MIKPLERASTSHQTAARLSPYETARECKHLADQGASAADIAQRMRLSVTQVKSMLLLMSAPEPMLEMVSAGLLSTTLAVETLRLHGDDALRVVLNAQALAHADGRGRLTRRHITKLLEKPSDAHAPALMRPQAPKTVLRRCVMWVNRNALHEDQGVLRLLGYLGGMDCTQVSKMLERSRKAMRRGSKGRPAPSET